MQVLKPSYNPYIKTERIVLLGHTLNLKEFTMSFWDYVEDHLLHYQALPADFEYEVESGESVVFDTYQVIGKLLSFGIGVPELVE